MKDVLRTFYDALTDALILISLCILGGVCAGLFLGFAAAAGFLIFNAVAEVFL